MSAFAGKSNLIFEPAMPVDLSQTGETSTNDDMAPNLGPLSQLTYKPARLKYLIRADGAATAQLKLTAGGAEIMATEVETVDGVISGQVPVSLAGVTGEAPLRVVVDVTAAGAAGETATIDAVLDVEQPLTIMNC